MATFVALIVRRWGLAGVTLRTRRCSSARTCSRSRLPPRCFVVIRDWGSGIGSVWRFSDCGCVSVRAPRVVAQQFVCMEARSAPAMGKPGTSSACRSFRPTCTLFRWLIETHTPFPLLAFAAPFVVANEKRRPDAFLAIGARRDGTCVISSSTRHSTTGRICGFCCRRSR